MWALRTYPYSKHQRLEQLAVGPRGHLWGRRRGWELGPPLDEALSLLCVWLACLLHRPLLWLHLLRRFPEATSLLRVEVESECKTQKDCWINTVQRDRPKCVCVCVCTLCKVVSLSSSAVRCVTAGCVIVQQCFFHSFSPPQLRLEVLHLIIDQWGAPVSGNKNVKSYRILLQRGVLLTGVCGDRFVSL